MKLVIKHLFCMVLILKIGFVSAADEDAYPQCPRNVTTWMMGNATDVKAPTPRDGWKSINELMEAAAKVSSAVTGKNYVLNPNPAGSIYYREFSVDWVDQYGQPKHIVVAAEAREEHTCPSGYRLSYPICINEETNACSCPEGKKFKASANRCIAVIDAPDDADPAYDRGPTCPSSEGDPLQPECGNPINPSNGNKVQVEADFESEGVAEALSLRRIYNASPNTLIEPAGRYMFGKDWSSIFDIKMTFVTTGIPRTHCYFWQDDGTRFCQYVPQGPNSSSYAFISMPDGRVLKYPWTSENGGGYGPEMSGVIKDKLLDVIDRSTYKTHTEFFSSKENRTYWFDSNNRLTKIIWSNGRTIAFTYIGSSTNNSASSRIPADSPICNFSQSGAVPGNGSVRLACVTDSWGRQINFEYETLPYDNDGIRVTKVIDPNGQQYIYSYDGLTGSCQRDDLGTPCANSNLTSVTYPDGSSRYYHYNELSHINAGVVCPGNMPSGNNLGNLPHALTGITDENGKRFADWTYDCSGRATSSQHAGGAGRVEIAYENPDNLGTKRSTVKTYTGSSETPTTTSSDLQAQIIAGRTLNTAATAECLGCGIAAERKYDANGNIASFVDRAGNVTNFTFDLERNLELLRIEGVNTPYSRSIATRWHDHYSLPLQIARPKLLVTFTYDSAGNLLSKTEHPTNDPNGGQGFSAAPTGAGRTWRYSYNNLGLLLSIKGPRTDIEDITHFAYDNAGNLSSITDAVGHVKTYSNYDANGRPGIVQMPNGMTTTYSYTARGKVASETTTYGDATESIYYSYDNVGQLIGIIYSGGSRMNLTYDDAHRLVGMSDRIGNSVTYKLDVQGNRIAENFKDPSGNLTRSISRLFDSLSRLKQIIGN